MSVENELLVPPLIKGPGEQSNLGAEPVEFQFIECGRCRFACCREQLDVLQFVDGGHQGAIGIHAVPS